MLARACVCTPPQDQALWACLAGMAIASRELSTAEVAYAAIGEVSAAQTCTHTPATTKLFGRIKSDFKRCPNFSAFGFETLQFFLLQVD